MLEDEIFHLFSTFSTLTFYIIRVDFKRMRYKNILLLFKVLHVQTRISHHHFYVAVHTKKNL